MTKRSHRFWNLLAGSSTHLPLGLTLDVLVTLDSAPPPAMLSSAKSPLRMSALVVSTLSKTLGL